MDIFLSALGILADPLVFALLVAGTIGGIIIGALPGLGSIMGITMALPLTFVLSPAASLCLLLGIYCGSVFGGAISAILINTPGTPQSAATLLDGYPMARAGKAGEVIGWATVASAAGGIIAALVFMVAAPTLASFGLLFGPIEYFALGVFALTCLAAISRENVIKGLLAGLIGLFVVTVGQDSITGAPRFSFGNYQLYGGIGLVPILVGLFALSEVFERMSERMDHSTATIIKSGFRLPGLRDIYRRRFAFLGLADRHRDWHPAWNRGGGGLDGVVGRGQAHLAQSRKSRQGRAGWRDRLGGCEQCGDGGRDDSHPVAGRPRRPDHRHHAGRDDDSGHHSGAELLCE